MEGPRIRLWALERHDLMRNYAWGNDPDLIRLTGMSPYPKSSWEMEKWYEATVNNPNGKIYAIKTRDGDYLGNIELSAIDWRAGKGEIGLIIGQKEYWSQGYGEEAIRVLLRLAFNEMNLIRVTANVLVHNQRARHTFEKCGFVLEGTARKAFYQDGRHWDVLQYALLREEFKDAVLPPDAPAGQP